MAVQAQADVGSLSMQGLGAFATVLATLSADNIAPMALLQMENLGALLPTNGEYAEQVKTLLQRCSDRRLDKLGLVIGWRKNDSASLMADSAGGQAVALLSMCLINILTPANTGIVLSRLCPKLLSSSVRRTSVASVSQLTDAARLLSGKLHALGFGNILAPEVMRIHKVYETLRVNAPTNLSYQLTPESIIDFLVLVSRSLCEEGMICRVSGSCGMANILGLTRILFPRSTSVNVEGTIIQKADNAAIRLEFDSNLSNEPTQMYLETLISLTPCAQLPIVREENRSRPQGLQYHFQWHGWLADLLQLGFLEAGKICDQAILEACCDFLMLVPAVSRISHSAVPLLSLLGPFPRARMAKACETIWRVKPRTVLTSIDDAFKKLVDAMKVALRGEICRCTHKCDMRTGFNFRAFEPDVHDPWYRSHNPCIVRDIWNCILGALQLGLWAFFIDAGQNAVVHRQPNVRTNDLIYSAVMGQRTIISAEQLRIALIETCGSSRSDIDNQNLAKSDHSCTIYPSVIETLSIPHTQTISFALVEGMLMFEHQYHESLRQSSVNEYAGYDELHLPKYDKIRPSHIGEPTGGPLLTIREGYKTLELSCTIEYAGNQVVIDLISAIHGYIGLRWAAECGHPLDEYLDESRYQAKPTSVAAPAAHAGIRVAMTRGNPMAQFFCCNANYWAVLQRRCCLNCAAKELLEIHKRVFNNTIICG
ncbi:hypothetical protein ACLMJK_008778 [Lecanora helva]